jgi:hypothetical protein
MVVDDLGLCVLYECFIFVACVYRPRYSGRLSEFNRRDSSNVDAGEKIVYEMISSARRSSSDPRIVGNHIESAMIANNSRVLFIYF